MVSQAYRKAKKAGLSPGTLVHIGEKKADRVRITVIDYDETHLEEKEVVTAEESFPFKESPTSTWINIDGLHQTEDVEKIGRNFGIHPLVLEDIVNTGQRPKLEDYEDYIFIVLKMLYYEETSQEIKTEQISMILGANFLITCQEREGDVFGPVRERIRNGKGRIRRMTVDYLAYTLIDAIVDSYFHIMEKFGERIEVLSDELVENPSTKTLHEIHRLKRELIFLRKSVWPLREAVSSMQRGESSLVKEGTFVYLRDVYDHTIQIIDTVETFREMVSGMLDTYLSSMSNRMNEVMKVLTIIATIFIPLTFIAGVYGMNFKYMPELEWQWGYFAVWGIMVIVFGSMLLFFKKRKWL